MGEKWPGRIVCDAVTVGTRTRCTGVPIPQRDRPRRCPRRTPDEHGAVVLEFALLVPVLLMITFGMIDFGYAINRDAMVNNAARDAARAASLDSPYSDIKAAAVSSLTNYGIPATEPDTTITIECTRAGISCGNTASAFDNAATGAQTGSKVTVTITYRHRWIIPLGGLCRLVGGDCVGDTITLTKSSEMVRE